MNKKIKYLFLTLLTCSLVSRAQSGSDFAFFEARLQNLVNKVLTADSDSLKKEANKLLIEDVEEILLLKGSFQYEFENIDNLSILLSPDKSFKLYNWVFPQDDISFEYYAYLQFYDKRKKELSYIKLTDVSKTINDEQFQTLSNGEWYGALYSKIIHTSHEKKNYYTLIGWDGNNQFTTKRIVDILHFDTDKQPHFGAPIIKMNDGTRMRMVMEYSKKTSTNMSFNKNNDYIVFDQLEPLDGAEVGMYEFYVPNLSYDGLTFKNGKWRFVENIPAYNDRKQDRRELKTIERGLQAP